MAWKNIDLIDWIDDGEEVAGSQTPGIPDTANSAANRMAVDLLDNIELLKLAVDKWATNTEDPVEAVSTRNQPQDIDGIKSFLKPLLALSGLKVTKGDPLDLGADDILAVFENADPGHNLTMCEDADHNTCYASGFTYHTPTSNWAQINSDDPDALGVGLFYNNSEVGFFKVSNGDATITKVFYINQSGDISIGSGFNLDNGFIRSSDTPSSYSGEGGKAVYVKDDETGVEFKTIAPSTFDALSDTPAAKLADAESADYYIHHAVNIGHITNTNTGLDYYELNGTVGTTNNHFMLFKFTDAISAKNFHFTVRSSSSGDGIEVRHRVYGTNDSSAESQYNNPIGDILFEGLNSYFKPSMDFGANNTVYIYYFVEWYVHSVGTNFGYSLAVDTANYKFKIPAIGYLVKVSDNGNTLEYSKPEEQEAVDLSNYYTKGNLQYSGQSSVHRNNIGGGGVGSKVTYLRYHKRFIHGVAPFNLKEPVYNQFNVLTHSQMGIPVGTYPIIRFFSDGSGGAGTSASMQVYYRQELASSSRLSLSNAPLDPFEIVFAGGGGDGYDGSFYRAGSTNVCIPISYGIQSWPNTNCYFYIQASSSNSLRMSVIGYVEYATTPGWA